MRPRSTNFNSRGTGERYVQASHRALKNYKRDKNPAAVLLVNSYWKRKKNAAHDIKESDAGTRDQDAGGRREGVQGADDQDRKTD